MNEIEYDINIFGDLMIIDNQNEKIETINVPSIKRLFNEKQELIKYLEDKIEEKLGMATKIHDNNDLEHEGEITVLLFEKEIYQEILDKVNGGNYE